ncbi:hypothetical protein VTL71DRAFT_8583 [Oculimacula yallundae]|uniref:Uncharacterized protein n=1 Tax=Oculimacula yallundae TaxID=86028 RepID=A0ABR4CY17_9HELO
MSTQGSRYSPDHIAELYLLEAALIRAKTSTLKDESFTRIQIMKEAHKSSEICADNEMQFKLTRIDAVNQAVMTAIRDEADTRNTSLTVMKNAKTHAEDEMGEARR